MEHREDQKRQTIIVTPFCVLQTRMLTQRCVRNVIAIDLLHENIGF